MILDDNKISNSSDRVKKKLVIRKKNILRVLREINECSTIDISRETNYLIPSINKMLNDLIEQEYVLESGIGFSSGGRKPSLYQVNADAAYFIGFDFGRAFLRFCIIDFSGKPICQKSVRIYSEITKEDLFAHFKIINEMCDDAKIDISKIKGMGLAVPESTERDSFDRIYPFNIRINEITNALKNEYKGPLYILNEPQALILGEKYYGEWPHFENVIAISVGYSLEMGIMINGEIYSGTNDHAGEIGHVKVSGFTDPCFCGGNGCLRTFASSVGVVAQIEKGIKENKPTAIKDEKIINGKIVNQYAEQGDSLCIDALEAAGKNIGKVIATSVNLFNPQLVILSGKMVTSSAIVKSMIKNQILKDIHPKNAMDLTLEISKLNEFASAMAVAAQPLHDIFDFHPTEVMQLV